MRRWCFTLSCCLLTLLTHAPAVTAQETTATIIGTVTDQSGAVLPGVVVSLIHVPTGRTFESVTSPAGGYLVTCRSVSTN